MRDQTPGVQMSPFDLGPLRPSRRPGLTPVMDLVFLLVIFLLLSARYEQDMPPEPSPLGAGGVQSNHAPLFVQATDHKYLNGETRELAPFQGSVYAQTNEPVEGPLLHPADANVSRDLTLPNAVTVSCGAIVAERVLPAILPIWGISQRPSAQKT
ncbi:MAG: hypothetical protein AAF848_02095 [Pseudomonadota bacterium]